MSDYEGGNAVDNFLTLVDGVDKILAAHPNDRGGAVTATQTLIGALGGGAQSYQATLKSLLQSLKIGCNVTWKDADEIYVSAGKLAVPDASGNVRWRVNPSVTTVGWANIDTGAEATSTWYYVYAVADASATTFTILISETDGAPTGATFYLQIGKFYNDAGDDIPEESVQNLGATVAFGNWQTLAENTVYQAATDGIVNAWAQGNAGVALYIEAKTDDSTPPTVYRAYVRQGSSKVEAGTRFAICIPVKSGDYYEIDITGHVDDELYFIPLLSKR